MAEVLNEKVLLRGEGKCKQGWFQHLEREDKTAKKNPEPDKTEPWSLSKSLGLHQEAFHPLALSSMHSRERKNIRPGGLFMARLHSFLIV